MPLDLRRQVGELHKAGESKDREITTLLDTILKQEAEIAFHAKPLSKARSMMSVTADDDEVYADAVDCDVCRELQRSIISASPAPSRATVRRAKQQASSKLFGHAHLPVPVVATPTARVAPVASASDDDSDDEEFFLAPEDDFGREVRLVDLLREEYGIGPMPREAPGPASHSVVSTEI